MNRRRIGMLGAGAFGTSLAIAYTQKFDVTLFSGFKDHVDSMVTSRVNNFFQDFKIPNSIRIAVTDSLRTNEFDYLLWVFPIKPTLSILKDLVDRINGTPIIICSKGLLPDGNFTSKVFEDLFPNSKVGYLAGPNFAADLARLTLSSADIVFKNIADAELFARELSIKSFKLFPSDDMVGAQICGAVKNIAAIACGIAMGLTSSKNTHAALLSFAIQEMKNLGVRLGAKEDTFYRLCGIGDLILTAFNETSRNFSLGSRISKGESLDNIIKDTKAVCEGYDTIAPIMSLAKAHNIKMPICEKVYEILFNKARASSIFEIFE